MRRHLPDVRPHTGKVRIETVVGARSGIRRGLSGMLTVYVDADACPVKEEVYRVARRYALRVAVVANAPLRVPADALVELVVRRGFGAADDWIAGQAGAGDVVVTADIPLAARCLANGARVLSPKGQPFTDNDIGAALPCAT